MKSAFDSFLITSGHDGWNLACTLRSDAASSSPPNMTQSYIWGPDVSGSLQGAGGVGGLLMTVNHVSGQTHFPAYDGNGNLMVLVRAETGTSASVDAAYEYDPFGRPVRATGPAAQANPFRFSTKFTDDETGLVYYGYRFYDAMLGRWLSRDPIAEAGGVNIYGMVGNDPVKNYDYLGKFGSYGGCKIGGVDCNPMTGMPIQPGIAEQWRLEHIRARSKWALGWWLNEIYFNESGVQRRDDGKGNEMAKRTMANMDALYFSVAKSELISGRLGSVYTTIKIPLGRLDGTWLIPRKKGIDRGDIGFWLHQANPGVNGLGGTFEAKCIGGVMHLKNRAGKFRWLDRIDARPDRKDGFWFSLGEFLWSGVEWGQGYGVDVEIDWEDDRSIEYKI